MRRLSAWRGRLTFANVAAALALVVAMSGTAYAAATITGADVVDGSLTGADLEDGSVQSADIGDRAIRAADLADASVLSRSIANRTIQPRHLSGATRAALGLTGYELVESSTADDSTDEKGVVADCPAGKLAVGGGYHIEIVQGMNILVYYSIPWDEGHGWLVQATENTASANTWILTAYAICVTAPAG